MSSSNSPFPSLALVLGSMVSLQCGSALSVRLFAAASPTEIVCLRLGFAALLLLAIVRPSIRGRPFAHLRAVLALGVVVAGMNWTFYQAIARMPLGTAVALQLTGPLIVAALASRRVSNLSAVGLAGSGVVLLVLVDSSTQMRTPVLATALALLSAAFLAAYILLAKSVGALFPGWSGLSLALTVAAVVIAPAGLASGILTAIDPNVLIGVLGVAVLSTLVPYSLEFLALRRLNPGVFGILISLEPAVAALVGVALLDQTLGATAVAGVGLVIAGSLIAVLTSKSASSEPGEGFGVVTIRASDARSRRSLSRRKAAARLSKEEN